MQMTKWLRGLAWRTQTGQDKRPSQSDPRACLMALEPRQLLSGNLDVEPIAAASSSGEPAVQAELLHYYSAPPATQANVLVDYTPFLSSPIDDLGVAEDSVDVTIDLDTHFSIFPATEFADLLYTVEDNSMPGLLAASIDGDGKTLRLTFAADQNGSASINVRATLVPVGSIDVDPIELAAVVVDPPFAEDTFVVTVSAQNDDPFVSNAIPTQNAFDNDPNTVLVLPSFFDDVDIATNGDVLTFSVTGNTNSAIVNASVVGNNLTLDYQLNQFGSSQVTIRATDLAGQFVEQTFTVNVTLSNKPPFVTNVIPTQNAQDTDPNTVLDLSGFFDDLNIIPNGDVLTFSVTGNTNPAIVNASQAGNNLTLDFQTGQASSSQVTVRATDLAGLFAEQTFTVNVTLTNSPPFVANPVINAVFVEDQVNAAIDLTNVFDDVDIPNGDALSLSLFDPGNAALLSPVLVGNTLTLNLLLDQNGDTQITVRATDLAGLFVDHQFTVTVTADNDGPTNTGGPGGGGGGIGDNGKITVQEDAADTVIDLSPFFSDVDGDPLTFSVMGNTVPTLVDASVSGNFLTLDYLLNQNGLSVITLRATDPSGAFIEQVVDVCVNPVNDEPTVANPLADPMLDEDDSALVIDISNVFDDVDILTNGDVLSLSLTGNTNTTLLNGQLVGTQLTLTPLLNQNGSAQITLRATDLAGDFVEHTLTANVNPVNDDPFVDNSIANQTLNEDDPTLVLDIGNVFDDVDVLTNGDVLSLSVVGNTSPTLLSTSLVGNQLSLTAQLNQHGLTQITIRATDLAGAFVDHAFDVMVNSVNDDPFVDQALAPVNVDEDAADSVIDLSTLFDDVDILTSGDVLSLSVTGNTNAALLSPTLVGNQLTLAYLPNQNGLAMVTLTATDLAGQTADFVLDVTVDPVNDDAPIVINPVDDMTVNVNSPDTLVDLSNVFTDLDIANGDAITISVTDNDNPGLVMTNLVGDQLTLSYGANLVGSSMITITGTDTTNAMVSDTFNVNVIGVDLVIQNFQAPEEALVPGGQIDFTFTVFNAGNIPVVGGFDIQLMVSNQNSPQGFASFAAPNIKLVPGMTIPQTQVDQLLLGDVMYGSDVAGGETVVFTATVNVPQNLDLVGEFSLFGTVDAQQGVDEFFENNNTFDTTVFSDELMLLVPNNNGVSKLKFVDQDAKKVKFKINKGTNAAVVVKRFTGNTPDLRRVSFDDATDKTVLKLNGPLSIGDVVGNQLKKIKGNRKTPLMGDVNIQNALKVVRLGDAMPGASVTAGVGHSQGMKLKFEYIRDNVDFNLPGQVRNFKALQYDSGQVQSDFIDVFNIKGKQKRNLPGNFGGTLNLTGQGAATNALGKGKFGNLVNATLNIDGPMGVNLLRVKGDVTNSQLFVDVLNNTLPASNAGFGSLTSRIQTLRINGIVRNSNVASPNIINSMINDVDGINMGNDFGIRTLNATNIKRNTAGAPLLALPAGQTGEIDRAGDYVFQII